MGEKLAITSSKAQTIRKRMSGILTGKNYQIVFLIHQDPSSQTINSRKNDGLCENDLGRCGCHSFYGVFTISSDWRKGERKLTRFRLSKTILL
ncbi:MAG: hypothetical protein AAGC64_04845 [Bacteroidota bacterium]